MGMHGGFIAAECDWPALHAALRSRCGSFTDVGEVSRAEWADLPAGQDVFHVAEQDGRTYVLEPSMVLSGSADLIVDVACELACLVVGAGAETVSGTFLLTAADASGLRRAHFDVASVLSEPFNLGEPFPSERAIPWQDMDGVGILARFTDLGFATDVFKSGPRTRGRRVLWEGHDLPSEAPLGAQINAHFARFKRRGGDDWTKDIKVDERCRGGYDLRGWEPRSEPKRRLRDLFRRR